MDFSCIITKLGFDIIIFGLQLGFNICIFIKYVFDYAVARTESGRIEFN
jgi:hypothetical protein